MGGGRWVRSTPPSPLPPFWVLCLFIYYKKFNILLHYFWKNLRQISSIDWHSNDINGNKNTKSYEFGVKILHRERRKVAKKLWFLWNIVSIVWNKYLRIKKYDITNHFQLGNFISAKDCASLYIFTVVLFIECRMTQCIVLKVQYFLFRWSKGPFVLLPTRDKRIAVTFH